MNKMLLHFFLLSLFASFNGHTAPIDLPANAPCNELIKEFLKPSVPRLEIKSGSLFDFDKSLVPRVEELMMQEVDLSVFYKKFELDNHRAPSLRDGMQFILDRKNYVLLKYEALISDLGKRNSQEHMNLAMLLGELKKSKEKLSHFKNIEQIDHELKNSFLNEKTSIRNLDEVIELSPNGHFMLRDDHYTFLKNKITMGNFQGEFGEIMALSSANEKILARGLTFKAVGGDLKSYSREISLLVDKLEAGLANKSEAELISIVKKHGGGLLRHAQEYINESVHGALSKEILIQKIMGMVRSKEIDVIFIDSKGKYVWSEVKAYGQVISKDVLIPNNHPGKKNIYDQLIEHQAMAELLGLTNVRFRFISPMSSVDEEGFKMISGLGYEVVYAK